VEGAPFLEVSLLMKVSGSRPPLPGSFPAEVVIWWFGPLLAKGRYPVVGPLYLEIWRWPF